MGKRKMPIWVLVNFALIAGVACGRQGAGDEATTSERLADLATEQSPSASPNTKALALDYGPKAPVAGYQRFEGSCTTFPYNLQVPEAWEIQTTGGMSLSKSRSDDIRFVVRVMADQGSVHAGNLERMVIAQGAGEVGRIQVGGQEVSVFNKGEGYVLNTPHGPGALFHHLEASSTLGPSETLKILDTLEPLKDC
jgi:hypothetical protein